MAILKLKYVKPVRDGSTVYYYFRRKRSPLIPLPGRVGSAEFMEAYQAALAGVPSLATAPKDKADAGTFGWLVKQYYSWVIFQNLKAPSKKTYRFVLEKLVEKHGHRPLNGMTRERLQKVIEGIGTAAPSQANLTVAILRRIFTAAYKRGILRDNPLAQNLDLYNTGTYHTWTDDQLAQFETGWPVGSRERLAYALYLYTCQRGGDVVKMNRSHITADGVKVVQEKTGAELMIDIHPDLAEAIRACPNPKGLSLIGNEVTGAPIARPHLTRLMRDAIRAAGLPSICVPHGLRKAGLTIMADNGASLTQLMAVSGHKDPSQLLEYTAKADQKKNARDGIAKMPIRSRTKSGKS